tara:strand:+ start:230 stop:529 length:300 start_codon:yes stop_codon:yes gene_type:complete
MAHERIMRGLGTNFIRRDQNQNLGAITGQQVGLATLAIMGSVVGITASGVINAFTDGYFHGRARKKNVTYVNIARRNAALGGVFGVFLAASILIGGNGD